MNAIDHVLNFKIHAFFFYHSFLKTEMESIIEDDDDDDDWTFCLQAVFKPLHNWDVGNIRDRIWVWGCLRLEF